MFIATVAESDAEGKLREIYEADRKNLGYVPEYAKVFSLHPDVMEAWRVFQTSVRRHLSLRRYELVTFAAAIALRCRYCLIAHGATLLKNGFSVDQLRSILSDYHTAGLEPSEVAMMDFARKIVRSADTMTAADCDALRACGFSDTEILDITLTATIRCFASKTFDALGARADAVFSGVENQLADLLPERS